VKLPTVVTSQKWLDIKSAQDEEKNKKCFKRVKKVLEKSKKIAHKEISKENNL